MKNRLNKLIPLLKKELVLYLGISFGVSFFAFIFKPFPLDHIHFDNRKLFYIGLGAIVFLVIFLVRIAFPCLTENRSLTKQDPVLSHRISGIIIWLLSSLAFSFYLVYAGSISLTFYLGFKVILICLAPPLILRFYDKMTELMLQNVSLSLESKAMQKKIDEKEARSLNPSIDLFSENRHEQFTLPVQDILFIRSADNYAEINYLNGGHLKKKLIRNTLRDIEFQLKAYPYFVRCHRICIINTNHIVKLAGNCNHHTLMMKGYDKEIPVSRQHFLKIREAIKM